MIVTLRTTHFLSSSSLGLKLLTKANRKPSAKASTPLLPSEEGKGVIMINDIKAKGYTTFSSSSSLGLKLLTKANNKPSTKASTPLLPSEEGKGVIMINKGRKEGEDR